MQFVLNYEEGGENSVLHGDAGSEQFLSEMFNPAAYPARHLSMEGIYEYGARVGVWRILREFERRGLPLTVFGVGMALERCPEVSAAFVELGHEIACHGWRWIHYQGVDEAIEREHMVLGLQAIQKLTGPHRPGEDAVHGLGWYTGRDSPNTRRLVAEHGGAGFFWRWASACFGCRSGSSSRTSRGLPIRPAASWPAWPCRPSSARLFCS